MIFAIIFSAFTILLTIYTAFLDYRLDKGFLSNKRYEKQWFFLVVLFVVSAVLAFLFMVFNFSSITVLVFFISAWLDVVIFLLTLWLIHDELDIEETLQYSIVSLGMIATICGILLGMYYLFGFSKPDIKKCNLIDTKASEKYEISTEEHYITYNSYTSEEKTYFLVISDSSSSNTNKWYVFYAPSTYDVIDESTSQISLNSCDIKLNYIPAGEKPYYQKTEYVYEFRRPKEKLFKSHTTKEVYNVYIPENDISYLDVSEVSTTEVNTNLEPTTN